MTASMGRIIPIIPYIMEKKKCSKPPSRWCFESFNMFEPNKTIAQLGFCHENRWLFTPKNGWNTENRWTVTIFATRSYFPNEIFIVSPSLWMILHEFSMNFQDLFQAPSSRSPVTTRRECRDREDDTTPRACAMICLKFSDFMVA